MVVKRCGFSGFETDAKFKFLVFFRHFIEGQTGSRRFCEHLRARQKNSRQFLFPCWIYFYCLRIEEKRP